MFLVDRSTGPLPAASGETGRTRIDIGLEPGLRASIVEEAAHTGVHLATDHAGQDTRFSHAIRRLVS